MHSIGERLKEERKRLGLSQARLCELMGISRKTLFGYETGERSPTAVFLAALCDHQFDVDYILKGTRKNPELPGIEKIRSAAETAYQMVLSVGIPVSAHQFSEMMMTLLCASPLSVHEKNNISSEEKREKKR